MTIIEPPDKEKIEIIEFNQVNEECRYCPCCGADFFESSDHPLNKPIKREEVKLEESHLFWINNCKVMRYHCRNCGCKYESEHYNNEATPPEDYGFSIYFIYAFCICFTIIGIFKNLEVLLISQIFVFLINTTRLILYMNVYKKHNKNRFKPYKVYKKIGDK